MLSGRQGELESFLEAKVGTLQVEWQNFYSITPLLFPPGMTTSLPVWGDRCGESWVSLRVRESQVVWEF